MWNPVIAQITIMGFTAELRAFGLASLLVAACTYPIYIKSMVDGQQTPPRSSWFLWFVLDAVAFSSNLASGTFDAMLFIYTIGTVFVCLATIRYGKKGWTKFESYCTAIVLGAVVVWVVISPGAAMICSLVGITVASLPLLQGVLGGAYESLAAWTMVALSSVFNLFDGQLLVGVWFLTLQIAVVGAVIYHHIYLPRKLGVVVRRANTN